MKVLLEDLVTMLILVHSWIWEPFNGQHTLLMKKLSQTFQNQENMLRWLMIIVSLDSLFMEDGTIAGLMTFIHSMLVKL